MAKCLSQKIQDMDGQERDFKVARGASLKERAAAKGLIYGAASRYDDLSSNAEFADRFVEECGLLVPEWEFKWSAGNKLLRPTPDSFNFTAADWMAKFARNHNLLLQGQTLVWHESLPPWFEDTVNRKNAEQLLVKHIETVAGSYTGQMHSWAVVNEAIKLSDRRSDGLRKTPWLEFLGPDYIELAFRVAASADPQALLFYNDFGLDYDTPADEAKRTAVLRLLERLKSRGTPVHALGLQAHLSGDESRFNARKLRNFLHDVASLGLKILVTELDVTDKNLPENTGVRDRIVAAAYEDYLSAVLDEPAAIGVLTWGLSDRYTWLSEFAPRADGAPVRSLPLDAELKRKLAWNALARAFDRAPVRDAHLKVKEHKSDNKSDFFV
jgi:endo-1,4-beta-xylanase